LGGPPERPRKPSFLLVEPPEDDDKSAKTDDAKTNDQLTEILMLLPPGEEQNITLFTNVARIFGLTRLPGVLFVSKNNLIIVDNYYFDKEDVLQVVTEMAQESKVECYYYVRPVDANDDPDRDELTGPVLETVKIRDEAKARMRQGVYPEARHRCIVFPYESIVEIRKRRYQLQRVAIEVFLTDGTSSLLAFDSKPQRDEVFNKLHHLGIHSNPNDLRVGLSLKQIKAQQQAGTLIAMAFKGAKSMTQQWQEGEVSNFTYLMYLNTLAGRSYNDLTQYPVFPWVLSNYESKTLDLKDAKNYRDLSKPMGAIGEKRKRKFMDRYTNWEDPSGIIPKFHYGTHYASAATTLYYLLRLEPFTRIGLQLQGGKFDHADRLFYSIQHSWHSSSADGGLSDVKELIPEFYYLPEFLQNSNRFDLGTTQWEQLVHDVELPPWAKGDARRFVRIMRAALESELVSANLHNWIDLIFGYKQQGKAAEEAQNVFYYLTYEDRIDIDSITDEVDKMSIIAQINNFGQTPHQIFKKPHPQRKLAQVPMTLSTHANILVPSGTSRYPHSVRNIAWLEEDRLMVACRNSCWVPPKYKYAVQWGHENHSLWFTTDCEVWQTPSERIISVQEGLMDSQICLCAVTDDGKLLLTAGESGEILVWKLPPKAPKESEGLILAGELQGHDSAVTAIGTSLDYQYVVSGGADGQVIIWDLKRFLIQRRLPRHPGPILCLAVNASSGDIVTCSRDWIYWWSVNGDLCAVKKAADSRPDGITCVTFASGPDSQIDPNIITGHRNGRIQFWKLVLPPDGKNILEPEFTGFQYETKVHRSLGIHSSSYSFVSVPDADPNTGYSDSKLLMSPSHSREELKENPKVRPTPRKDAPYMMLVASEKRKLHAAAVTSILCPSHSWTRMWSADASGEVRAWKLTSDEHWVNDSTVSNCPRCRKAFNVLERRHHCRYCGGVFCNSCSMRKTPVPQFGHLDPVRVCNDCFTVLQAKRT